MSKILILAVSRKNNGYCVAGKDVNTNKWIRIVSTKDGGPLYDVQIRFLDLNGDISYYPLYRIMDIQLGKHVPLIYQPENYLLSEVQWQEADININDINFIDMPPTIWGENDRNDRIDEARINNGNIVITQSLYLIQGENVNLYYRNLQRRVGFDYNGLHYDLASTVLNRRFDAIQHGRIPCRDELTISLGEPFNGNHYKLISGIV